VECSQCHRVEKVSVRIAQTLVDLTQKHGHEIPLTRNDIARLAGTTVETTIRMMNRFKREGITSGKKGLITILDVKKLQSVS